MNAPLQPVAGGISPDLPAAPKPRWWRTPGGVVVICTVAALLVLGPLAAIGAINERSGRGDSTVEISACILNQAGPVKSATIRYTVTNSGPRTRSYVLRFEVADATGARVGDDVEFVNDVGAGQTVRGEAVALLGATGQRCGLTEWR